MVAIPPQPAMTPEAAFARLQVWYGTQQKLGELKTAEVLERKALAAFYFPSPEEGTNRLTLGGGFDLKLGHSIKRKVDEAALENVKAAQAKKLKLNLDELFPTKPTLNLSAYRELTEEQRAFVDTLLDISEGETPSLQIVPQADTAGAAAHKAAAEAAAGNAVATGSPAAGSSASEDVVHAYTIVETAEDAEPGHYYTDGGGNWWCLTDAYEWEAVEDAELVASLEAQVAMTEDPPPAPAKPARKRRSRKAKGGDE